MFSTRPRTACAGQSIDGEVVWREEPVIADGERGFSRTRLSRELKALAIQPSRCRERHDHGQNLIGIVRIEFSPSHSFCGRSMFWRMTVLRKLAQAAANRGKWARSRSR